MKEQDYWESFKDEVSVNDAIWESEDKKIDECLNMIVPNLNMKGRIFDLGCGTGRLLKPLSERFPDVQFTGIDFSAPMIEFSDKNKNIKYVQNDGVTIPFNDDYFDGGYSMVMLQHNTNEVFSSYIKEVGRVLKKGGLFVFQFVEGQQQHFLSHHSTVAEVMKWVTDSGMKIISVNNGIYEVWKWMTIKK